MYIGLFVDQSVVSKYFWKTKNSRIYRYILMLTKTVKSISILVRQACFFYLDLLTIQYFSNSTRISTNSETAIFLVQFRKYCLCICLWIATNLDFYTYMGIHPKRFPRCSDLYKFNIPKSLREKALKCFSPYLLWHWKCLLSHCTIG